MKKLFLGITIGLTVGVACSWYYYTSVLYADWLTRDAHAMRHSHTFLASNESSGAPFPDMVLYDFCLNYKRTKMFINKDLIWHHHWSNWLAEKIAFEKAQVSVSFIQPNDKYLLQCNSIEL